MTAPLRPLTTPTAVVTAGASLLADALDVQGVTTLRVDWAPPVDDTGAAVTAVMGDPRRRAGNALALERMLAAEAALVDVRPAAEALGLERGQFLHAGPPARTACWSSGPSTAFIQRSRSITSAP